jgi:hypothetical protein
MARSFVHPRNIVYSAEPRRQEPAPREWESDMEPKVGDTVFVVLAINPDWGDESGFSNVISEIKGGEAALVNDAQQRSGVVPIKNLSANGEGKWKPAWKVFGPTPDRLVPPGVAYRTRSVAGCTKLNQ